MSDKGGRPMTSASRKDVAVGVVIPSHNRPGTLPSALDSVLSQSFSQFRVVIVDDGSSPPVRTWLDCSDSRVTILRNDSPEGPAAARNRGAEGLETDWIAFLDDDDRWLEEKLYRCLSCLDAHPDADMIVHKAALMGARRRGEGQCSAVPDAVRWMLTSQPPHVDCVLVRRPAHERVRFDEAFPAAADLDYMIRLAMSCTVVQLNEVLAVHGSRGSVNAPSAISLDARLAARQQFHAKHWALFSDPTIEAMHRTRLGHLHRRASRRRAALLAFLRALRVRPWSAHAWKGIVACCLGRNFVARASRGARSWNRRFSRGQPSEASRAGLGERWAGSTSDQRFRQSEQDEGG